MKVADECRQGEIWWAQLPMPSGRRPVLILTRTDAVERLTNVTVAPITRTIRYLPSEVILSPQEGVLTVSAVNLHNIITIPRRLLDYRLGAAGQETMQQIFAAMRYVFAMPHVSREA